jgi:endonuclease/exonuclease/phosphatase family metal-dependent hydrolase
MRIASYNIQFGGVGREQALGEVVRSLEPDVVVLQEANDPRVVRSVAEAAGMRYWYTRRGYSLALMSRLPVESCVWQRPRRMRHAFLQTTINGVTLFGVHLQPYFSRWSERQRGREVHALLRLAEPLRHQPHLLLGDFNAIAPSDVVEIRRMPRWIRLMIRVGAGVIATYAIRTILEHGYLDAYRMLYPEQPGATLPAMFPHLRLDYVFVPDHFRDCLTECTVVTEGAVKVASDHCPLVVDFQS